MMKGDENFMILATVPEKREKEKKKGLSETSLSPTTPKPLPPHPISDVPEHTGGYSTATCTAKLV